MWSQGDSFNVVQQREQISPSMTALTFGSAAVICFSSSAGNSLDRRGRPQFKNLMFRRGNPPCFFAFDLLTYGKDLRTERLLDRKQELRRLLARSPDSLLKYTEYIEGCGRALFQRVCELDLEGIVAKHKFGPYVVERESSTWFKILNREYSQKDNREDLFERERHSEPVAGWHSWELACAELEHINAETRKLLL